MEIRILKKQGLSIRGIARELGISRETVRKYLRAPDREPVYTPRAARPSKLDAHKDFIRKRVTDTAPHRLPATVLLRELRERGYDGGITILKAFLAAERPVVVAPEIKRFETERMGWTPPHGIAICQGSVVEIYQEEEASVDQISIIGLDIAKNAFHAHGAALDGSKAFSRALP